MEEIRRRKHLNIEEKMNIIRMVDSGLKTVEISRQYGLATSTISTLKKNRDSVIYAFENNQGHLKRLKKCSMQDLDVGLLAWVKHHLAAGGTLTGPQLRDRAESLAGQLGYTDFICNHGWVERFRNRHNITYKKKQRAVADLLELQKLHSEGERSSSPLTPDVVMGGDDDDDDDATKTDAEEPEAKCIPSGASDADPQETEVLPPLDTSRITRDDFELFGSLVASQLRALPLKKALACQEKIFSVLTQTRLSVLNPEDAQSPTTSCQTTCP